MAQQMKQPKLEVNAARVAAVAAAASVATSVQQQQPRQTAPHGLGQAWKGQEPRGDGPRIAFIVTTSDSLQQIRVWINYHRAIGVTTFYIFADGQVGGRRCRAALAQEHEQRRL